MLDQHTFGNGMADPTSELDNLARREHELLGRLRSDSRYTSLSSRTAQEKRIFSEYVEIHREYVRIGRRDLEGLKRALFLQWYEENEPPYLSGIAGLDPHAIEEVVRAIIQADKSHELDREMRAMLAYYGRLGHWDDPSLTTRLSPLRDCAGACLEVSPLTLSPRMWRKVYRGQMTEYFDSTCGVASSAS